MAKGLAKALGFKDVNDLVYNAFGAKNVGDLAKDTAAIGLSTAIGMTPVGVPLQMATGKTTDQLLGYQAKSDIGKKAQKVEGVIPSIQKGVLGVAASNPSAIGQGLNSVVQQSEKPMYKKGGMAGSVMINVEKDELCVDPNTLEVIDDYKDMPEHPKGKDIINQKGNTKVSVGSVIIPADMRKDFLKGSKDDKVKIMTMLIDRQAKDKAARGGYVVPKAGDGVPPGAWDYVTGVNAADAENAWEQPLLSNYTYDDYMSDNPEQQSNLQTSQSTSKRSGVDGISDAGAMSLLTKSGFGSGASAMGLGYLGQAIPQFLLGKKQYDEAQKGLNELNATPLPRYTPTSELEQTKLDAAEARDRAKYGFSNEQKNITAQNIARAENTQYQRLKDLGGAGLQGAMNAITQSQQIGAISDLAAKDAQLQLEKQKYKDSADRMVATPYQSISNSQTAVDQQRRLLAEKAYGAAMKKGLENKYGALGTAGAVAGQYTGQGLANSSNMFMDLIKLV